MVVCSFVQSVLKNVVFRSMGFLYFETWKKGLGVSFIRIMNQNPASNTSKGTLPTHRYDIYVHVSIQNSLMRSRYVYVYIPPPHRRKSTQNCEGVFFCQESHLTSTCF